MENNQSIMDSKDEKVKKILECATKRITQCNNFHASVWVSTTDFTASLLSCLEIPTPSSSRLGLALAAGSTAPLSSRSRSPILSLSYLMPALSFCLVFALLS